MLITKKKPQTFDHKQPQQEIFNHDPAGQLVKIQKHFTLIGESIDIVKENIVESRDLVPRFCFNSQPNIQSPDEFLN